MTIEKLLFPFETYVAEQNKLCGYGSTRGEAIKKCWELVELREENNYQREFNHKNINDDRN